MKAPFQWCRTKGTMYALQQLPWVMASEPQSALNGTQLELRAKDAFRVVHIKWRSAREWNLSDANFSMLFLLNKTHFITAVLCQLESYAATWNIRWKQNTVSHSRATFFSRITSVWITRFSCQVVHKKSPLNIRWKLNDLPLLRYSNEI